MAKHKKSKIWMLRKPGEYPNGEVYTTQDGNLMVGYVFVNGARMHWQEMSRMDARLLARRINQCLEDTK